MKFTLCLKLARWKHRAFAINFTVRVNEDFSVPGEIDSKASVVEKDGLYYVIVDGTVVPVTLQAIGSTWEYTCLIDQQIYEVVHRVIDGPVSWVWPYHIQILVEAVTAPMPDIKSPGTCFAGETVKQSSLLWKLWKWKNIIKSPNEGTKKP